MSKELSCDISYLFVPCMIINCIAIILRLSFSEFHVVHANTVVGERFSVYVSNGFANLQELFVRLDSLLVLAEIVEQDTC